MPRRQPATVIPVHYEGWSHFSQGRAVVEQELAQAPGDIGQRVRWLRPGVRTEITV